MMDNSTITSPTPSAHLILGGARSGKSSYAESLALRIADQDCTPLVYIATASAGDLEMKRRIERHQHDRDNRWQLIEESTNLASVIESLPKRSTVLVDCLTLWLSNCLCNTAVDWPNQKSALLRAVENNAHNMFIVSNEISMGVVPLGELTREYVDELGWLHQDLARICQQATLVIAGLPQKLK